MAEEYDGLSACECPVCFNIFNETLSPMSMPCGHTLCSSCVNQLVASGPSFRCPLCREWVNKAAVMLNHTLRDLIGQLSSVGVAKSPKLSALHVDYNEITLGSSLDRGAFGEVYRGSWRGNVIAVKMFSSGVLTPEALRSFQREVYVMNCLRHPNVVLLMGACQTPPKLAILMEFVAGGSLHKLLHVDKTALPIESVCVLGADICRGLQYLHSINILHRDLKSKNVLLTTGHAQAKLCDFGLARMRLESATLTGNVGTVHWSAPEVLSNTRYQFPADVYSLGMVLFEMATGTIPFGDMVPLAVMMAVAVQKNKPVIPDTVHPVLTQLITRCISWEPVERPSVSAVLVSLQSVVPAPSVQEPGPEVRGHSDSLGVVFVSVAEGTDSGAELIAAAQKLGIVPGVKGNSPTSDDQLAQELASQEYKAQLARDAELANQLQIRENTYRPPSEEQTTSLKQVLKESLKSSKSVKSKPAATKAATPTTASTKAATPTTASTKSASGFLRSKKTKVKTTPTFKSIPPSKSSATPPSPPPLPRVVAQPVKAPRPSEHARSTKRHLLNQVRKEGARVYNKLRPVETVEKRAFRVGRVVDGYSSERAQFTTQNLILSFHRKLLRHVIPQESPPSFPVGRVVSGDTGQNIKRLSSVYEREASNQSNSSLASHDSQLGERVQRLTLSGHVQRSIQTFDPKSLHHTATSLKQWTPTAQDLVADRQSLREGSAEQLDGFW